VPQVGVPQRIIAVETFQDDVTLMRPLYAKDVRFISDSEWRDPADA
jgi:hypothetical protein